MHIASMRSVRVVKEEDSMRNLMVQQVKKLEGVLLLHRIGAQIGM